MEWMLMPYRRYADLSGRSQRMEYWMFTLFSWLVVVTLAVVGFAGFDWQNIDNGAEPGPLVWLGFGLAGLFLLGSVIPHIAVTVRRFHDQDKSGWMYLLTFVPYVGGLIVFVFMCMEGTRGPNRYGPDPNDPHYGEVFS